MRVHLNLFERDSEFQDDEGIEVSDMAEARRRALLAARDILAAQIREGFLDVDWHIEITGANGKALSTLSFADAFRIGRQ